MTGSIQRIAYWPKIQTTSVLCRVRQTPPGHDIPPISVSPSLPGLVTAGGLSSSTPLTTGGVWTASGTTADSDTGGTGCESVGAASFIVTSVSVWTIEGSATAAGVGSDWVGAGSDSGSGAGAGAGVAESAGSGCSSGFGSSNLLMNLSRMLVRSGLPS